MSISYNVLTIPDTAVFERHISALKPRWLLFKDNLSYAAQIGANNPTVAILHRDYANYQGDDDLSLKISPRQWLYSQRALGSLNVWRYCCNENAFNEHTLAWLNDVVELNAQQNQPLKLVIGNFATGSYPPDGWKQPQAVKLLHYLDYNRQWLVLGCHEYFGATPTSGYYGGFPSNANIASNPTDAPGSVGLNLIPRDKWPADTSKITLWHCGRFRFILKTCDDLGIPYPRIVVTEHGADDLGDIDAWLKTLQKTAPYTSIRGWRSLKNQWRDWYGDDIELTYYNMLTYLDAAVYTGSPVEAQLIFGWGDSGGWEQFRVDNAPEFQRRLEMYAGVKPPVVVPPPIEQPPANKLDKAALLALVEEIESDANDAGHKLDDIYTTLRQIKDALK